jgi:hypothetical protein
MDRQGRCAIHLSRYAEQSRRSRLTLTSKPDYQPMWVTKLDVAARQARTAVRLFFEEVDPISLHTLVAAAHTVLKDLSEKKGSRSIVKPPGYDYKINAAENFFKHAYKDPDGRVNIEPLPRLTVDLLFDAVVMLQNVSPDPPIEAKIFWAWFVVNNEKDFLGAGPAIDGIIKNSQEMRSMSLATMRELLRFQQILNTEEPLPPWANLGPIQKNGG